MNTSAQGEVVTPETGIAVPVGSARQIICGLTDAILRIDKNRGLIDRLGQAASADVQRRFTESHYLEQIECAYAAAIDGSRVAQSAP
jgi:glycosyltransferase involved in cell wall biosynthesis